QRAAEAKDELNYLKSDFAEKGIKPYEKADFEGMRVIDVSGGSQGQFAALEKEGLLKDMKIPEIRQFMQNLLKKLDPNKVFFLTGGTQFGVEKILHEEVAKFNAHLPAGQAKFRIAGSLPKDILLKENLVKDVLGPADSGITHYILTGKTWADSTRAKLDIL